MGYVAQKWSFVIQQIFQKVSTYFPKDPSVRKAIALGFCLRIIPLMIWLYWPCVRDECTYLRLAERMVDGDGMTASNGWIWAPGYPFLVGLHKMLTGFGTGIKVTQCVASVFVMALLFHTAQRFSPDEKIARCSVWLYALSPTQIFFAQSLWSECLYGGLLLLALRFFDISVEDSSKIQDRAALKTAMITGVLVGICVLFRGVATYMLPIFAFALLWNRWREIFAYKQVLVLVFAAIVTVTPYSIYATKKFGSFMISDRTLGQMMWLGNNAFPPIAFDWGNGPLSNWEYERHTGNGRKACGKRSQPVQRDKCQTQKGVEWIKEHPEEFFERMPLRVAQMFNPHSFLTRHLRWGNWSGLPRVIDETVILWNVCWNLVVLWLGSVGLVIYGQRHRLILIGGICAYHVAAISILAGLTRYRVPLEPLLMIYAAWFLVRKENILQDAKNNGRLFWAALMGLLMVFFTMWFFPTGWVWWRHW